MPKPRSKPRRVPVMRAPEFWRGGGVRARTTSTLLLPSSWVWRTATRVRGRKAKRQTKRQVKRAAAVAPVVCIGNAVVGGAGKTPTCLWLLEQLRAQGIDAHAIALGYGGKRYGRAQETRKPLRLGNGGFAPEAVRHGDEACLLARRAPTWICRDRAAAARASARAGAQLIISDDGHQNPDLKKDFSLLVIGGEYGFGNERVLIAGPLRETPLRALKRADAVLVVGDDSGNGRLREILAQVQLPVLRAALELVEPEQWRGKRVIAFAGIARPEHFFRALEDAGAELLQRHAFPDHHRYRKHELTRLRNAAEAEGAILITTEKDAVRLPLDFAAVALAALQVQEPERLLALVPEPKRASRPRP